MKKDHKIQILFVVIALAWIFYSIFYNPYHFSESKTCIRNVCFDSFIADTEVERSRGLSIFDSINDNESMLFVFDKEGVYPFWMKNMKFSIDMIWIDENKKIVFIEKNVSICHENNCPIIYPGKKAKYVLEINAGLVDQYRFIEGNSVFTKQ